MCAVHRHEKCVMISVASERGDGLFACTYAGVCVYCACHKELALIMFVVTEVSVRPHTLGYGCNCLWQAVP